MSDMSRELILSIETSTALCSVALSSDGELVSHRSDAARRHASLTSVFCREVLDEAGISAKELSAVCISDGPGSYTGLRVGLSTAKGICFGAGVKLLSVSSLDVLAAMGADAVSRSGFSDGTLIVPMIDARRMEVFAARYDSTGMKRLCGIEAVVVDGNTFSDIAGNALFIGDGALKCRETIGAGHFVEAWPDAKAMVSLAHREFAAGNWRDVAYFEPFYLKEFVATVSKKKLF